MAGNSHAKTCVLRVAKFEIMYYGNNVGQKSHIIGYHTMKWLKKLLRLL